MTPTQTRALIRSGSWSAVCAASAYGFAKSESKGAKIFFGLMAFMTLRAPFTLVAVAAGGDPDALISSPTRITTSRTLASSAPTFQPSAQSASASLPVNA